MRLALAGWWGGLGERVEDEDGGLRIEDGGAAAGVCWARSCVRAIAPRLRPAWPRKRRRAMRMLGGAMGEEEDGFICLFTGDGFVEIQ